MDRENAGALPSINFLWLNRNPCCGTHAVCWCVRLSPVRRPVWRGVSLPMMPPFDSVFQLAFFSFQMPQRHQLCFTPSSCLRRN